MTLALIIFAAMKMNQKIIASLFLLLFIAIQATGIHQLTHHDDADESSCVICLFHSDHLDNNFIPTDTYQRISTIIIPSTIVKSYYIDLCFKSTTTRFFFNKAPPTV